MAQTEMAQCRPPLFVRTSNTPPDSPSPSPVVTLIDDDGPGLSPVVTLSDEQGKEIADAVSAMKMAPAAPSLFHSSRTSRGNPPPSPSSCPTCLMKSTSQVAVELAKQIMEAIKSINAKQGPPAPVELDAVAQSQPENTVARASKVEIKTVDEVYVLSGTQV